MTTGLWRVYIYIYIYGILFAGLIQACKKTKHLLLLLLLRREERENGGTKGRKEIDQEREEDEAKEREAESFSWRITR